MSALSASDGPALCSHWAPGANPQIAEVPFGGGCPASFGRAVWKFCNGVRFLTEGARGEGWGILTAQGPHGVDPTAQLPKPMCLYHITSTKGEEEE